MATEQMGFDVGSMVAAADLSAKQYYCVKKNTTNNQVALCAVDGEVVTGVLQNKPGSGIAANVRMSGITKIECGETLAAGDLWGTDSSGKAKKVERTVTGADVGDYFGGEVIEGADAGELATVSIGFVTGFVEAQ